MTIRRRRLPTIVAGGLLAAGLVACGDASEVTESSDVTVPHVGDLPDLNTGRQADGRPAGAAPAGSAPTGSVAATTAGTGGTEDTEAADTTEATEPPVTTSAASTADPPAESAETTTDGTASTTAATTEPSGPVSTVEVELPDDVIGPAAAGNRILALGDSITASIGPQYGGQLCDALVEQGWYLGVDAFQGRTIDDGLTVLRDDIDTADWDAAIVNLGSNYGGDPAEYAARLRQILARWRTAPVLLVTVTEFEDDIAEVNFVIRDVARELDDVWIVEWSELTRYDDSLTGADGLHLSEPGRAALAEVLAAAVGDAPDDGESDPVDPACELLRDAEADGSGGAPSDTATGGSGDDGGG